MIPKPDWLRLHWFAVNIVLFSPYAVFDAALFFWPRTVHSWWIIAMYSVTMFINCLFVIGLITRLPRINYLVAFTSFLMAVHLAIFIDSPLCLSFAYLGLPQSFYSLFIIVMSRIAGEGAVGTSLPVFNIAMAWVHEINVVYFSRRSVTALSTIAEDGMVTAA